MNHEETRQKLLETLNKFDTVMVINEGRDGALHGRPMMVAEVTPSGELWFVTSRDSEKAREVSAEGRAVVTGQSGSAYVSVSGDMDIVVDRIKVHALWREGWKVWFPMGPADPNIVFMRLRPGVGEYWSTAGGAGVRHLFAAAKAFLSGERANTSDPEQHAKVRL